MMRGILAAWFGILVASAACGPGGGTDSGADGAPPTGGTTLVLREPGVVAVDIVVLVDNSGSVREEQIALIQRFPELLRDLFEPPDSDGDTRLDHPPANDVRVGIISPDMGTAGFTVTTCRDAMDGDAGCFLHSPASGMGCADSYPPFLSRDPSNSAAYALDRMAEDFACVALLGEPGCGFEQPLKAMQWAVIRDAVAGGCNEGFLRRDSIVVLIWMTDEDDSSGRPEYPELFDPARNADLGHLNIRCFLHPEMLVAVEDYVNAFQDVRPDSPGDVLLGLIVGVPPDVPACIGRGDEVEGCLEAPQMTEMINPMQPTELVPSCNTTMGLAFPPVRLVRLAEAFGARAYVDSVCKDDWRSAMQGLGGIIGARLQERFGSRVDYTSGACLPRTLPFDGTSCVSPCVLVETLSDARPCAADPGCPADRCPAATAGDLGRLRPCVDPSTGAECVPLERDLGTVADAAGVERRECLVRQAPRDPFSPRCADTLGDGWYYQPAGWSDAGCAQVLFAGGSADPVLDAGSGARLWCPR